MMKGRWALKGKGVGMAGMASGTLPLPLPLYATVQRLLQGKCSHKALPFLSVSFVTYLILVQELQR